MRYTVRRQLKDYLLLSWVMIALILFAGLYLTYGKFSGAEWKLFIFVVSGSGGFMWSLLDFWTHEETQAVKKRKLSNTATSK